ncbi:MAG: hypothetical protein INQ03_08970 [Candidatus Heimdallarchaeota archaeon]|nr:hypothetical protein [Candidatus Heimdallarchaeota archaeon]
MSKITFVDKKEETFKLFLLENLDKLGMSIEDLMELKHLSPYLILDGHRSGNTSSDMTVGYMEGAKFSLRFAAILKKLGGTQANFLIHTLRNYKTMDRMKAIFAAVEDIGASFINTAYKQNIKLRYYGHDIHEGYALSRLINAAEHKTQDCNGFDLNYLTNYSEIWAVNNLDKIADLPEVTVIGRFTKGHYSGAGIPGKASKANFCYIQQASISDNWTDEQMVILILGLLKSHIAINGAIGGKVYKDGEKELIYQKREQECWEENYNLGKSKRMETFTPTGPVTIRF